MVDDPHGSEPLPVSVIIPAFNRAALIGQALDSVSRQAPRRPAEVVVVDDASSDGTAEAAAAYGVRVVRQPTNLGPSAARNSGLAISTQPWVAFLDSDDEWFPHHLDTLWSARNGHVLVCGSCLVHDADQAEPLRVVGPLTRRARVLQSGRPLLFPENFIAQSGVLIRRDLVLEIGGYDESRRQSEDLDLWVRVLERGSGVVLPQVTLSYRRHADQAVENAEAMRDSHLSVLQPSEHSRQDQRLEAKWLASARWDDLRSAQRDRQWRLCLHHAMALLPPRQLGAVAQVLVRRYRARREACRYGSDGSPSVAILPGRTGVHDESTLSSVRITDLRDASPLRLLTALVMRPPGMALASTRWQRQVLRLLGVNQIRKAQ